MMMAPAMSAARKLGAAAKLQMSSEQSRNTSTTSNLLCWREMLEDATLSAYFRVLGFETTDAAPLLHSVAINPSFRVCQLCTYIHIHAAQSRTCCSNCWMWTTRTVLVCRRLRDCVCRDNHLCLCRDLTGLRGSVFRVLTGVP